MFTTITRSPASPMLLPGFLALVLALLLSACATTGEADGSRRDSNQLSREEILATDASNLYDAIHQLRPRWLTVRGTRSFDDRAGMATEIVVYQNQTQLGGLDVLRQLPLGTAYRLRFMDGATASASLPGIGSRHVAGAIVIETAAPR